MELDDTLSYEDTCVILDEFGIAMQLALGAVCATALVIKRFSDRYRRSWLIWFMAYSFVILRIARNKGLAKD